MHEGAGAAALHDTGSDHRLPALASRPATRKDVLDFYGRLPGESLKAIAITMNGEVAGILGIAIAKDASKVFSDHAPELEPYLKSITVMRAVKRIMQIVREHKGLVYAVPTHDEARRIMSRLGFTDCGEWCIWER